MRRSGSADGCVSAIAATSPSIVCGCASTSTANPAARAVAEVTGPIEAILIPASASLPVTANKFVTVDELVNVIQSGLCASASFARAAASAGTLDEVIPIGTDAIGRAYIRALLRDLRRFGYGRF